MKSALSKDTIREIKKSFGRFLSIFAIVAIGVAFFAGVKAAAPDMKFTADKYYDDYNLMDLRVLTTMGLTNGDINAIRNIDGVKGVYPTHSKDVITTIDSSEIVLKVHAMPIDNLSEDNEDFINRPKLVEGRYPEKSGECLIEKGKIRSLGLEVGSKIKIESGTKDSILDSIKVDEYTIVGTANTPYYLSYEKGYSSIGNGSVNSFIIIPESDFNMEVYTEALVTVEGAKEENSYNDSYFDITDKVKDKIEGIAGERSKIRIDEIKAEAEDKLSEGKKEYNEKKLEYDNKILDATNEIESSRQKLANSEEELNNNENKLNTELANGQAQIKEGEQALKKGKEEYTAKANQFNSSKAEAEKKIKEYENQVQQAEEKIPSIKEAIVAINNNLSNPNLPLEDRQKLNMQKAAYEKIISDYEEAKGKINESKKQLSTVEAQLKEAKNKLDKSEKLLIEKKQQLENASSQGKKKIENGRKQIEEGKAKLEEAEKQLEESKLSGKEQLENAEKELEDAEKKLDDLKEPEWTVLDRKSHYSYVDYGNAADRIDAISKVFPVFFFLVAALVCLTTMTRMVDEERGTIGTLKALGYSKAKIASKYIIYAMLASCLGSIVGLAVGMVLFPTVIFNAWGIMYVLPPVELTVNLPLCIMSMLAAVLITVSATISACYKELTETPSLLMRPKAPKEGKRILLERMSFIWNRFNFIEKVTARNIFRYKKRFFMTVIGISGCTALLLAGFGIKDSIKTIAEKQFGEILKYDSVVSMDNESDKSLKKELYEKYKNDDRVNSIMKGASNVGSVKDGSEDVRVNIVVPSDVEQFKDFIKLRTRVGKKDIELDDNSVVITERLSRKLNLKVGDRLKLDNGNDVTGEVKIGAISEMYVDHYIYMTPNYYKSIFNEEAPEDTLFIKLKDTSSDVEERFGNDVMNEDIVKSVTFYSSIVNNFEDTIAGLNYVVIVLIISAGALAFVVLYNLTNINISERIREIATIKVLGFYDNEVSAYVYRENIVLTVIGALVGLGLGTILHRFIMITVELDTVMFGRNINGISYLYALVITLVFAILVNLAMYFKLKNVKMVESLKSVE